MARKLFCEWHPVTYQLVVIKNILLRRIKWLLDGRKYASTYIDQYLPTIIYQHKSLIRRKIGNADMQLQENKATNLKLAAPKMNNIIIRPQEVFSFWKLLGKCTSSKGFKEGLVIRGGKVDQGIGGGMCQFTNLIHWMVLHSPLEITEHHHHHQMDMFPDYGRQIPFGTGTSIMYNYLDYQFINPTTQSFQLIVYTTEEYLCGELRSENELEVTYHIKEKNQYFEKQGENYYRNNEVYREIFDKQTGILLEEKLLVKNHSKVLYEEQFIHKDLIRQAL
ncbi:MAG: VanW family protein [Clostridia bacterium]|nr:VanW family protein [Clostridia bacterium]